ncbi:MAG: siderophore-interacting protein [Nocardioides sp.]|nr:siderophore-interacting protein [Nocardioides sp.]
MARTNISATRIKPAVSQVLTLEVIRTQRISEHFSRITLGGGDIGQFTYLGFDQWFRLFIPVSDHSLSRLPNKLNTVSYLRYLTISKTTRPVLRNYTVRAYRANGPDGPELDVDFVLHGSADDHTSGPAATWAQTCTVGDPVAILDEGVGFNPDKTLDRVRLVADESGLPAAAGILASLPDHFTGQAVIEIPTDQDRQQLTMPAGVEMTWVVRDDHSAVPGRAALETAQALATPDGPFYGWVTGEQTLPSNLRRHWIHSGVPKQNIMFCGYWKAKHL